MFTRTTGCLIVPLWLASMGWLVAHDVWPTWTAQDPPHVQPTEWLREEGNQAQFTVLYENTPIGAIWTDYLVDADSIIRRDIVWIERLPNDIAPLRVIVDSTFTGDGLLDEIDVRLANRDADMTLHGERFHSDFSFTLESGPMERAFKVPLADAGMITGAFHPFAQLENLKIGQTWRMQVFNPVAALTGVGSRFISMLVSVVGEETIATPEGNRRCLVVQSPSATAWVDHRGVVLVQEMTVPVVGTIRIIRESGFDEEGKVAARNHRFHAPPPRRRRS